jgi:hypothetical protein
MKTATKRLTHMSAHCVAAGVLAVVVFFCLFVWRRGIEESWKKTKFGHFFISPCASVGDSSIYINRWRVHQIGNCYTHGTSSGKNDMAHLARNHHSQIGRAAVFSTEEQSRFKLPSIKMRPETVAHILRISRRAFVERCVGRPAMVDDKFNFYIFSRSLPCIYNGGFQLRDFIAGKHATKAFGDGKAAARICSAECTRSAMDIFNSNPRALIQMRLILRQFNAIVGRLGGLHLSCCLIDGPLHRSVKIPVAYFERILSQLHCIGIGFSSNPHLIQLAGISVPDSNVHKDRDHSNSNEPILPFPNIVLKLLGAIWIAIGIMFSTWGWRVLISSNLSWDLNRRLITWLPCNALAAIFYWHGFTLLLGV